jgi:Ca2+-binding EF-hand superfamily protein
MDENCKEKLAVFFNNLSDHERKVEITRQVLAEHRDFDATQSFRFIDTKFNRKISKSALREFFQKTNVNYCDTSFNLLFDHIDRDADGAINWKDFVIQTISKDCSFFEDPKYSQQKNSLKNIRQKSPKNSDYNLTPEMAHSLARVFQQEMDGLIKLETEKSALVNSKNFDLKIAFKELDFMNRGFFDLKDIHQFMYETLGPLSYSRSERILRRLDFNMNGRVDKQEWMALMTPLASSILDMKETRKYELRKMRKFKGKKNKGNFCDLQGDFCKSEQIEVKDFSPRHLLKIDNKDYSSDPQVHDSKTKITRDKVYIRQHEEEQNKTLKNIGEKKSKQSEGRYEQNSKPTEKKKVMRHTNSRRWEAEMATHQPERTIVRKSVYFSGTNFIDFKGTTQSIMW